MELSTEQRQTGYVGQSQHWRANGTKSNKLSKLASRQIPAVVKTD